MDATEKKKQRQRNIGTILIVTGIVLLICVIFFWIFGSKLINTNFELDENQRKIEHETSEPAENQSISIPGFESAAIPPDTKTVPFRIYNPENNPCYFEVILYLDNGNKEVYKSKLISPGNEITEITLNEGIPAGTYTAILHYNTYSMDGSYTPMNGADVPFTLIVK